MIIPGVFKRTVPPAYSLVFFSGYIVCKVERMPICCTGAGTDNFQVNFERLQLGLCNTPLFEGRAVVTR